MEKSPCYTAKTRILHSLALGHAGELEKSREISQALFEDTNERAIHRGEAAWALSFAYSRESCREAWEKGKEIASKGLWTPSSVRPLDSRIVDLGLLFVEKSTMTNYEKDIAAKILSVRVSSVNLPEEKVLLTSPSIGGHMFSSSEGI